MKFIFFRDFEGVRYDDKRDLFLIPFYSESTFFVASDLAQDAKQAEKRLCLLKSRIDELNIAVNPGLKTCLLKEHKDASGARE